MKYTTIAMTTARMIIVTTIVPMVSPDMFSSPAVAPARQSRLSPRLPSFDPLELPCLLGQRELRRQALHAGGAVEAVALRAMLQDVGGVVRHGDRAAMAEDDDVGPHGARRGGPGFYARHAIGERQRGLGADRAAGREAEMADDDVGAGLGHGFRLGFRKHIGRRQEIELI